MVYNPLNHSSIPSPKLNSSKKMVYNPLNHSPFKRVRKDLLTEIHSRKTVALPKTSPTGAGDSASPLPSSSSDDLGSSSTSSPGSKKAGFVTPSPPTAEELENLSPENEKLKREKQLLALEIELEKKQCDDLMAFLCRCVKEAPDQIDRIRSGTGEVVVGEMVTVGQETNGDFVDDEFKENGFPATCSWRFCW